MNLIPQDISHLILTYTYMLWRYMKQIEAVIPRCLQPWSVPAPCPSHCYAGLSSSNLRSAFHTPTVPWHTTAGHEEGYQCAFVKSDLKRTTSRHWQRSKKESSFLSHLLLQQSLFFSQLFLLLRHLIIKPLPSLPNLLLRVQAILLGKLCHGILPIDNHRCALFIEATRRGQWICSSLLFLRLWIHKPQEFFWKYWISINLQNLNTCKIM